MKYNTGFIQQEERLDTKIDINTKKLWNVQIEILEEIKRICLKHNIKYMAIGGTLLGAIRHKGFIPWDNDIDICMMRDDFNKFCEVAPKELPADFFYQYNNTENKFFRVHGQLRYSPSTMLITADYKKKYNRGIFVDIFILDKAPLDEKIDNQWRKKLFRLKKYITFSLISSLKGNILRNFLKKSLGILYIFINGGRNKSIKKFDHLCEKFSELDNYYYDLVSFNLSMRKLKFSAEDIERDVVDVPFEYSAISIPTAYDKILTILYGEDYMTPVKAPTFHGNTFFQAEIPYTEYDGLSYKEFCELFTE